MSDTPSTTGSLETPKDAGRGQAGVVHRWMMEIDLAGEREQAWRVRARETVERYRDESDKGAPNKRKGGSTSRFNILWANTSIMKPKLFSSIPRPDVRRRWKEQDPVGKKVSQLIERGLTASLDQYDFEETIDAAILDYLLPGRGLVRVRYDAETITEDREGDNIERKAYEAVLCQHWPWDRLRIGPAAKWSELPWIAFEHQLTRDEAVKTFGEVAGRKIAMDVTHHVEQRDGGQQIDGNIFQLGTVWEIWDKPRRQVIWISPGHKDSPILVEDDPLNLEHFFPVPRALYSVKTSDTLVPIEEYRLYRDQAEELDQITRRIQVVVKSIKVRGIYASIVEEMKDLMKADDGQWMPSKGALTALQRGGIKDMIWMMPVHEIAQVLQHLYIQRDQIKNVIYEITGLSDIMRGASNPNETFGAQQLKAQSGGLRMQERQREVQRFIRDILRLKAEIMCEQFSEPTWQLMTGMQVTPDMMALVQADHGRGFRIDIETNSTIALDQHLDEENVSKSMEAFARVTQGLLPAVQAGLVPEEIPLKLVKQAASRMKFGRELEDAIDQAIGDEGEDEQQMVKLTPEQFETTRRELQAEAMEVAQQQAQEGFAAEKAQILAQQTKFEAGIQEEKTRLVAREEKVMIAEARLGLEVQEAEQGM